MPRKSSTARATADSAPAPHADFPAYQIRPVADLIPYARNARTHSQEQIARIAASIREYGFLNPIITDGRDGILAGHARVLAAQRLGLKSLPCIEAAHLTEAQRRAYVIADNRLALDAGWDADLLRIELEDLQAQGFDLSLTGFDLEELRDLGKADEAQDDDDHYYSRKIEPPVYEITGECPPLSALMDRTRTEALQAEIAAADLPDDVRAFLHAAAERHTVFSFRRIAEYYAHAEPAVQRLMEKSALVIIDFDRAIELGFVELSQRLMELAGGDDD